MQALGGLTWQSSVPVARVPRPTRYGKMAGTSPLAVPGVVDVPFPFDAVLFDCDGVLVDSAAGGRVLSEMLTARGWPLTPAQAGEVFLGQSVAHLAGLIAERTGKPFTEQWLEEFRQQRNRALEQDLEAIQGRPRPCVRLPRPPAGGLPAPPVPICSR